MQATPTSSTIKLTTTKSATAATNQYQQHQSSNKFTKSIKTSFSSSSSISSSSNSNSNNNSNTINDQQKLSASKEIEEISKKISEHADAIYRTWKYRGLAPTEILDIYTNVVEQHVTSEVADIFGGSVEAAAAVVGTTEGLQKLVNQFVIKDKEKRGVKTTTATKLFSSSTSSLSSPTGTLSSAASTLSTTYGRSVNLNKSQRTEPITTDSTIMPENIGSNKMTQKTGISIGASAGGGSSLKQATTKSTTAAQKLSKATAAAATTTTLRSGNSNENSSIKKLAKSTGTAATAATAATTTTTTAAKTASSTSPSLSSSIATAAATTTTSPATALKNNACVKNVNSAQQQRTNNTMTGNKPTATAAAVTPTPTTTTTTKRSVSKGNSAPTIDINLNLDLGFDDLQLDVNSLSQLQAQNLLKIKELLQETPTKTKTTTTTAAAATPPQESKKSPITKTTKIKRAKSPAKLLDSPTVTDSPIVTKTKLTKVVNENDQYSSSSSGSTAGAKKTAKNVVNSVSISDKPIGNSNSIGVDVVNDVAINKLINASGKSAAAAATPTTMKTKGNTTTKSTIAKKLPAVPAITPTPTTTTTTTTIIPTPTTTTKPTNIINHITPVAAGAVKAATTTPTAISAAAAAASATANVVSSVKTVDHQSIKSLESNSVGNSKSDSIAHTNGSCNHKAVAAPVALNDKIGQQQLAQQKSPTINKISLKDSNKINESEHKINSSISSASSSSSSNVKIVNNNNSAVKPHKSIKSGNSAKATTAATAASATIVANSMEIAPQSKDKNNSNTNSNSNSNSSNVNDSNSNSNSMPAPTKLNSGRAALGTGAAQDKLNRPFLTRGSVAERVLMFEKCPGVRNSLDIKRPDLDVLPKSLSKVKVKLHSTPPSNQSQPEQNSLQKEIRTTRSVYIPRFYFPHGKPQPQIAQERCIRNILAAFDTFPNNQVTKDELPQILKICGLPFYWRMPVVVCCQQNNNGLVERTRFLEFWKQMNIYCHDAASRFVYIHSRGQRFRSHIAPEDLVPLVQDVVDTHPGLAFLKEATEFHSRYVHTVIARIFYSVNRSWSGKITISELKKSDLLEIIQLLEEEDDINQIMAFFSYEHFYVIYCKFWELDKDHDLLISQDDLARHSDHALSSRIVERIFSGCVTRSDNKKHPNDESKMSYTDFVWFILSEEDKRTPTAIEYWFRCMDLDGDGLLSMYELEYFYEEQQQRMESIGIETLPFEDCLCQMLDMIKPQQRDAISLGDLKRCKMTQVFFDTFFNLEKYLDHEQRDPFATQRDEYSSDWDRFAAHEYELLISEENG